jgi:hypothetical protein
MLALHRLRPGVQTPVQLPLAHTNGQLLGPFVHLPLASQVCGVSPLHWVEPGAQSPVHCPVEHTKAQVWLSIHWACWLQACWILPLHRVVPGTQTPVHWLLLQMKGQGLLIHWPVAPQV